MSKMEISEKEAITILSLIDEVGYDIGLTPSEGALRKVIYTNFPNLDKRGDKVEKEEQEV